MLQNWLGKKQYKEVSGHDAEAVIGCFKRGAFAGYGRGSNASGDRETALKNRRN